MDSYRSPRSGRHYRFRYLRLGDLAASERLDAVDREIVAQGTWDFIRTCPGIRDDFVVFYCLLDEDDEVACSLKAIPDVMWHGKTSYHWAWFGSLYTRPEARGEGLATFLEGRARDLLHEERTAWSSAFSADASLRIHEKLGFTLVGYAPTWVTLRSIRPLIEARTGSALLARMVDMPARPILKLVFHGLLGNPRRWPRVSRQVVPAERMLEVLKSMPPLVYDEACHFDDSPEKLVWKIDAAAAPRENTCQLEIISTVDGDPLAYIVVRRKSDVRIGAYRDFSMDSLLDFGLYRAGQRAYDGIVSALLETFWHGHCDVLEVIANNRGLIRSLRRAGAVSVARGMPFTVDLPDSWGTGDTLLKPSAWRLTSFCGDGFTY